MPKSKNILSDKQKRFCEEYIIDLNATQAAIRAGYSEKTARQIAADNLSKVNIQNVISELRQKQQKRTDITADRVLSEFAKIAFANPKSYYDQGMHVKNIHDLTDEQAACISKIKTKVFKMGPDDPGEIHDITFELHSKVSALESLGKHTGIYQKDNEQKPVASVVQIILPDNGRG